MTAPSGSTTQTTRKVLVGDVGDAAGQGCGGLDIADGDDGRSAGVGVEGFADLDGLGFGVVGPGDPDGAQVGVGREFGQVALDIVDVEDLAVDVLALAGVAVDQLAVDVLRCHRKAQHQASLGSPDPSIAVEVTQAAVRLFDRRRAGG